MSFIAVFNRVDSVDVFDLHYADDRVVVEIDGVCQ